MNFDSVAWVYRWLECLTFGGRLQRCRTHFLAQLSQSRKALILGDGDGRFTAALLDSNPQIEVHAVDSSAKMLALLTKRCNNDPRLRVHHADVLIFAPTCKYDLVVTNFFLDCLSQRETDALVSRLSRHLKPDSLWLVSEFCVPRTQIRYFAKPFIRFMYFAFRITTGLRTTKIPDYATLLERAGMRLSHAHSSLGGILSSQLWKQTSS